MARILAIFLLMSVSACTGMPQQHPGLGAVSSACLNAEASYACQVERYHNVSQ